MFQLNQILSLFFCGSIYFLVKVGKYIYINISINIFRQSETEIDVSCCIGIIVLLLRWHLDFRALGLNKMFTARSVNRHVDKVGAKIYIFVTFVKMNFGVAGVAFVFEVVIGYYLGFDRCGCGLFFGPVLRCFSF